MNLPKIGKVFPKNLSKKINLKNFDKRLVIAVPLVIIMIALTIFGKGGKTSSTATVENTSESTIDNSSKGNVVIIKPSSQPKSNNRIVIATWNEEVSTISDAVNYFKKRNPETEVEYKILPVTTYMSELETSINREEDIDLFLVRNINDYAIAKEKKLSLDIDQNIRADNIDTSKYGRAFNELRNGGKLFGLPYKRNVYVLFYNKSILEKLKLNMPEKSMTWTDYKEFARKISSSSIKPKVWGAFMDTAPQSWLIQALQKGSTLTDSNFVNFEMALKYRIEMEKIGAIPKFTDMENLKLHYNSEFQKGNIAMNVAGDWQINMLLSATPQPNFQWDIAPAPHPDDGNVNVSIGNYSIMMINAGTKNVEKAYSLLKLVTGEEGANKVAQKKVLPGFVNDSIASIYADKFSGIKKNFIVVAKQDFILEYPVSTNGYKFANTIYYEESRDVFLGRRSVNDFSKRVKDRLNKQKK
jgi:multiple sugar transport system substrate-binding protein